MRKVPQIYLLEDTTWEEGKRIDAILKKISGE
jgi:ribosome-binding factor A